MSAAQLHRLAQRRYRASRKGKRQEKRYAHSEAGRNRFRTYRQRNPQKATARKLVRAAVLSGELVRPTHCETCKMPRVVEAHHRNYRKPLDVTWHCKTCHEGKHH